LSIEWFYSQHDEHRIAIPRFLHLLDAVFFSETNTVEYVLNALLPFTLAATIFFVTWRAINITTAIALFGVSLCLLFWVVQQETFLWGFAFQIFLVNLFAFFAILLACGKASLSRLVWVLAAATITVFCMGNGLLVLPFVVAIAIYMRWPRQHIGIMIGVAVCLVAIYFADYHQPVQGDDPLQSLYHLPALLQYFLIQIGSPFGNGFAHLSNVALPIAGVFGGLGIAAFALLCSPLWRSRPNELYIAFLATGAFILGSTMMCAAARLRYGVDHAMTSRYCTFTALFWVSVFALLALRWHHRGVALVSGLFLTSLAIGSGQANVLANVRNWHLWDVRSSAIPPLLAGVSDSEAIGRVSFWTENALRKRDVLKAAHASIFFEPWSDWLGTSISSHVRVVVGCEGGIDRVEAVAGSRPGWRVSGSALVHGQPAERLLLADQSGTIVGYGLGRAAEATTGRWVGATTGSSTQVVAYALFGDEACRLRAKEPQ